MQIIKRTIDLIMRRPENIVVFIGAMLAALTILYGVSRFGTLRGADRDTTAAAFARSDREFPGPWQAAPETTAQTLLVRKIIGTVNAPYGILRDPGVLGSN